MTDRYLDADLAGQLLGHVWPDVVIDTITTRTGGQLSAVYEVRCARPATAVILKIYDEQWRWKPAKEVHVYNVLNGHGVGPVPRILHAEPDPCPYGFAYTVMTLIPGQPLSQVISQLDNADSFQIYQRIGASLSAIHRIRQSSYGYLVTGIVEPEPDNTAYMTRQFNKKLREFRELGGDPTLHDAISRHAAERGELFARCGAPVLCHNNFHEGNALVDRRHGGWAFTGFIDVENAIAADPLMDIAKTAYYSVRRDQNKLAGLLDGYGPLPDDWRERLKLYTLYHALELWDWFASIDNRSPLPGIADDIRHLT
ncbi:phosphotransferase family protein [Nocardia sp. XZ_19_369]|uniref:phosphotransferase family protein n=1 Tax=Nocardia sp. XZ_19_369 TaxID=2769487 RepID=UPI00188F9CC1|nr:aminoglycoside phosphotransferase family protein [Nocardia sp. XZ_19_369]